VLIYAGKTFSSRYDKKAPVHVAMVDPDGDEQPRNLCTGMVMAPVQFGGSIDVTCRACAQAVLELQQLVSA
jgi:heptaprenylglyceryl phosphate synthase